MTKINCKIQEPFTVLEPIVVNWDFRHASLLFHTLSAYSCSWLQHAKTPACFKLCSHVRTYICNCRMGKMANMCEINCTCGCFAKTCECKYHDQFITEYAKKRKRKSAQMRVRSNRKAKAQKCESKGVAHVCACIDILYINICSTNL